MVDKVSLEIFVVWLLCVSLSDLSVFSGRTGYEYSVQKRMGKAHDR